MLNRISKKILPYLSALFLSCSYGLSEHDVSTVKTSSVSDFLNWTELEPLKNHIVHVGAEDSKGNLWFSTFQGLLKYDGYRCHLIEYPDLFKEIQTTCIYISLKDEIYVSTAIALLVYTSNHEWEVIDRFKYPTMEPSIRHNIVESKQGHLFVTTPNGFFRIKNNKLEQILPAVDERITSISITNTDIWGAKGNEVVRYPLTLGNITENQQPAIYDISTYKKNDNDYCIVTSPSGKVCLTNNNTSWEPLEYIPESNRFEPSDFIQTLGSQIVIDGVYTQKDEILLLHGKSSALITKEGNKWKRIKMKQSFPSSFVFIFERKNGNLIIGGRGESIFEINRSNNRWTTYKGLNFQCQDTNGDHWFISYQGEILKQSSDNIWTKYEQNIIDTPTVIHCSKDGYIWVAGAEKDHAAISYFNGKEWQMNVHPSLNSKISYLSVKELNNGQVIFGSGHEAITQGGALVVYTPESKGYHFDYISENVPGRVAGFAEHNDELWYGGMNLSKTSQNKLLHVEIPNVNFTWTDSVLDDGQGNVWLGLWGYGVFKWDGKDWTVYNQDHEMSSNNVSSMVYDKRNNYLWVATNSGISRLNTNQNEWIRNATGNPMSLKREGGSLKLDNQENLWINSSTRVWYFRSHTDHFISDYITDQFHTTRFTPDNHPPVVQLNPHTKNLSESSNVRISWAGQDYDSITPQKFLTYSYRINDEAWSNYNETSSVILSDRSPGEYTFEVKCRDIDGNISPVTATSTFIVYPVIWKRAWFILLMSFIFLTIVALVALLIHQRIQSIIRLDEFKLQFFTNISHELRTPLTVIQGPIENVLNDYPENEKRRLLEIALKNTQKMQHLVDQILEFRKLQTRKLQCHYTHGDIINCIQKEVELTEPLCQQKSQKLVFTYSTSSHTTWFDSEKLEKVVNNLLLNAIKYTPKQGTISIRVSINTEQKSHNDELELIVEDNGMGIPNNRINQIFEPFYQIKTNKNQPVRGSGLGLAYVKSLIDAMKGTVTTVSPITQSDGEQSGTRFIATIPLIDQIIDHEAVKSSPVNEIEKNDTTPPVESSESSSKKPHLLIVDDDPDILEYLSIELKNNYKIETASNGKVGFEYVKKHYPEIILTDVMMPHTDGRQLCKKIKSDPSVSHVPVIMFTALKSDENELKGLEYGADDYLTKPININILKHRIHKQLESRKQLRDLYAKQKHLDDLDLKRISTSTTDEDFIESMINLIEINIEDPLFDVEKLAQELHMSRVTLYRKFKSMTGESPSAFLKTHRLKKAAKLLVATDNNVSEVSDAVGFQGTSHFCSSFKKQFGCSPTEYKQNIIRNESSH